MWICGRVWDVQVRERGVALFLLPGGLSGVLAALEELPWLLSNTDRGEEQQLDFLRNRMNASFRPRRCGAPQDAPSERRPPSTCHPLSPWSCCTMGGQ